MVTHDHEEAFTVADELAVMRAGRVVQHGELDAVWRAPVDVETALFLGYARVLTGAAADLVLSSAGLPPGDAVAVRRSALAVDPAGPLAGRIRSLRTTPEQLRLEVDVEGLGRSTPSPRSTPTSRSGTTCACASTAVGWPRWRRSFPVRNGWTPSLDSPACIAGPTCC